ncbi:hypothetical protein HID58_051294 [Brassica napus]|uniref:Non-haem dioxygenase N-terminal domain-containing protein n=1 Tax=Brassica napus TaxID=3708 RepID=A0ABQ8A9X2_BRANA|nr:hypothetical protein HID58_051294 [Brassica napus]
MSSSEIRAHKNQPPSLISSLPEYFFVDIVAPCLSILLPESLPSLHINGEEREKTLSDIAKACEEWGFFQLVSHGTPLELLNKVKELSSDCYKIEREEAFKTSTPVKLLNELLEKNSGEKLESVDWEDVFTLLDHNQNEWPSNISGLKETMLEYIGEVMKLASKMMEASNLTSEDLSLTVLAPTSFTSPISPFLRFFEFTERVQTENAILQRISISNESSRRQSLGGADIILKLNGFFTTYYPSEATRAIVS